MGFKIFKLFRKKDAGAYTPQYREATPIPNAEVTLSQPQGIETTKLRSILLAIIKKHKAAGIEVFKPASAAQIAWFEQQIGFPLPADFKEFYSICNGFGCSEDIFNMVQLEQAFDYGIDYEENSFSFSEYMIYSDTWGLRLTSEGKYEIFNGSFPTIAMTDSLETFLTRFLKGNVFEDGGLYDWHEELGLGK